MRMIRGLAARLALPSLALGASFALAPSVAEAQQGRTFQDAWFWGVKAGGMSYSTVLETNRQAPLAGVDWVITRSRGGLYVSYDQAFFDRQTAVIDQDPFSGELSLRPVDLKNMRRVSVLAMGFPMKSQTLRPYFGLGLALNHIGSAQAQGDYQSQEQFLIVDEQINEQKTSFSPTLMVGAQYQLPWAHVFVQGVANSAHRNFFLNDGNGGFGFSYELGLRYNIGRSIER